MLRRFALALGAARKINTAERERFMDKLKVNPDDVEAARGSRLLDARHCSTFVGDLRIADKGGCYTYSLLEVTRADGRVIVKEVSPADRNEDSIKGLPEVAVVAVSQAVSPLCATLVCHPCAQPLCATLVCHPCVPPLCARTLVCRLRHDSATLLRFDQTQSSRHLVEARNGCRHINLDGGRVAAVH
jgi:hypothetical protein